jgi:hypothetical protein
MAGKVGAIMEYPQVRVPEWDAMRKAVAAAARRAFRPTRFWWTWNGWRPVYRMKLPGGRRVHLSPVLCGPGPALLGFPESGIWIDYTLYCGEPPSWERDGSAHAESEADLERTIRAMAMEVGLGKGLG